VEEVVMSDAVIIDAVRTPLGKGRPGGALAGVHPVDRLAQPLAALGGDAADSQRKELLEEPGRQRSVLPRVEAV
jgi:acetyl-CoA acetyltransferase